MALFSKIITRIILFSLFAGIVGLIVVLARGYRFNLEEKSITSTGILSVNSAPEAAKIFVNGELKGVTNQNIAVSPGYYDVKITKEGFTDWQKQVKVLGEVVLSFEAVLFPKNPSLSPLTNLGVAKALPVGQSDDVLIFTKNDDVEKDGIYMLEGNSSRLSLLSPLKKIILTSFLPSDISIASAEVSFSPNYSEGIFTFPTEAGTSYSYLLSLTGNNNEPFEISNSKDSIVAAWERDRQQDLGKILETLPKDIKAVATDSFRIIAFSPDETKVLYQAKEVVTLPQVIKPPLIGSNQTEEKRTLEVNKVYVYDRKEDKNFMIPVDASKITPVDVSPTPELGAEDVDPVLATSSAASLETSIYNRAEVLDYIQWYPSSKQLVLNEGQNIAIMDYDGTNKQSVYAGPYIPTFFGLNSDWKLLILLNLNPQNNVYGDIYEVGIR